MASDMDEDETEHNPEDAMDMGFIGSLEPSPEDFVSTLLLQQMGSSGRSYKREQ